MLGDEAEGDRLALLDELEAEVDRCYEGTPEWPVMQQLQPTIREFDLPREPFLRLIECNRIDQRKHEYDTWEEVEWYCDHSADPVGRLVLGLLRRADDDELVRASDDVCTGLQLVNFLQDVPRDLELGRVYLPLEDRRRYDVTVLDEPNEPLTRLLRFEAERARGLLGGGQLLQERIGGRIGARGRALRPGRARRARRARGRRLGHLHAASAAVAAPPRAGGVPAMRVEEAYTEVERLTRERARNFAYGIRVLPKAKRRAISAIYAFAREVDDTADGDAPPDEKRRRLGELHRRLDVPPEDDAMWIALADARERFPISAQALHDFVDGGLMDLDRQRYDTFDELRGYCAHVAGAVGVACIGVYGADQPQRAETLGIALQLINIMRDVREDWELGRVYLPQDELAAHGVGEDDIRARRLTPAWQSLMAYQAARARDYLEEGLTLLDYLDHRSSACVGTFAGLYRATLERIEERGFDVFDGKPHLSTATKLRIVAANLL